MDVKTAVRIFELYEQFAQAREPLAVSELAERMGIPVSSCFSLVKTAERMGYLYALRPRGPLYPTRRMLDCMEVIVSHDPVAEKVADALRALRDEVGETVVLGQRAGDMVRYLAVYDSPQVIRYQAQVGELKPLHANSIGKALLGLMTQVDCAAACAALDLSRLTPTTLCSSAVLAAAVEAGRLRGWQENFGESSADLGALACGVMIAGMPVGISLAGPLQRIVAARDTLAAALLRCVERVHRGEQAIASPPAREAYVLSASKDKAPRRRARRSMP